MTTENKQQEEVVLTVADRIWNDIKDVELGLFALDGQLVNKYCTPVKVEPSKLYMGHKDIGAVLPAVEVALAKKYNVELQDRFIVVSYKTPITKV